MLVHAPRRSQGEDPRVEPAHVGDEARQHGRTVMAPDMTILFYTANLISEQFAEVVRGELVSAIDGRYPIVCVSHAPMAFGDERIVIGQVERSIWRVYKNVLTGALVATTPFIAMAEDDSLYARAHFDHRPQPGVFSYNLNRFVLTRRLSYDGKRREALYYWRRRTQQAMLVCSRDLLVETLTERFAKYPEPVPHDVAKKTGWGEPGRYEKNLGLTRRTREYFETLAPCITVNHSLGLMGRRRVNPDDLICDDLPPWGNADALWRRIHV